MPRTKGRKNHLKTNITKDCAEEAAGKRDECGRDSGKAEINKNQKNKCRVDKLNSRSSHGIF